MSVRMKFVVVAATALLSGCASGPGIDGFLADQLVVADTPAAADASASGYPEPLPPVEVAVAEHTAWGEPTAVPHELVGPRAVAESDGPYLLDTGDRLRIFVYGQPNLSRLYIVDHDGKIVVPLIGPVNAGFTIGNRESQGFSRPAGASIRITMGVSDDSGGNVNFANQTYLLTGNTLELVGAFVDGNRSRANWLLLVVTASFLAPDLYVVAVTREVPTWVYLVLGGYLLISSAVTARGLIGRYRTRRAAAAAEAAESAPTTASAPESARC